MKDDLDDLFSKLSILTPSGKKPQAEGRQPFPLPSILTTARSNPDSENEDDFQDAATSLPTTTNNSILENTENDDSEVIFNPQPHQEEDLDTVPTREAVTHEDSAEETAEKNLSSEMVAERSDVVKKGQEEPEISYIEPKIEEEKSTEGTPTENAEVLYSEAELDPFKTNSKVAMSPVQTSQPSSNMTEKAEKPLEEMDPFQTNNKVAMSPPSKTAKPLSEVDPSGPNTKVSPSPVKPTGPETLASPEIMKKAQEGTITATYDTPVEINPFETNTKVAMSPAKINADEIDPFKTQTKIVSSPVAQNIKPEINPFETNTKVGMSPAKINTDEIDPFKAQTKIVSSPAAQNLKTEIDLDVDPFKGFETNTKVAMSPAKINTDEIDPFKTQTKIVSSPAAQNIKTEIDLDVDPFKTNSTVTFSPVKPVQSEIMDNFEPFKTKSKVVMSPAQASKPEMCLDVDPFKASTKFALSPAKPMEAESTTQPDDSDTNPVLDEKEIAVPSVKPVQYEFDINIDPFNTNSKVALSPIQASKPEMCLDIDPFKASTKVALSPARPMGAESTTQPDDSDFNPVLGEKEEVDLDIDPFKTNTKFILSPVKQTLSEPDIDLNIDPFKTKSQIATSPTKPEIDLNDDPFKTNTKVPLSPVQHKQPDINLAEDKFKTNAKVVSSPVKPSENKMDSIKPNSQVVSTPVKESKPEIDLETDPFKTKSNVTSSPVQPVKQEIDLDIDPFKTKSHVAMSPVQQGGQVVEEDVDPFQTTSKVVASPSKDSTKSSGAGGAKQIPQKKQKNGGNKSNVKRTRFVHPGKAKKPTSDPMDDIQMLLPAENTPPDKTTDLIAETPHETAPAAAIQLEAPLSVNPATVEMDEFDPNQEEFVDASEIPLFNTGLNDSGSWDFLAKCGSGSDSKTSALSRESLYVKFDPLVTGRQSMFFKPPPKHQISATMVKPHSPALPKELARLKGSTPKKVPVPVDDLLFMNTPPKDAPSNMESQPGPTNNMPKDFFSFSPADSSSQKPFSAVPIDNFADVTDQIVQVVKYSESDLSRIKKELILDYEAKLLCREKAWCKEREEMVGEARRKDDNITEMAMIITEYEANIEATMEENRTLTSSTTHNLKEVMVERDQALDDLKSVEKSFSDLLRRYEKVKDTFEGFKKNEAMLRLQEEELTLKCKKAEHKYIQIKQKAEEKLEALGTEMERSRNEGKNETTKLQVALRRSELLVKSLEQQLEQKTKENQELAAICDELLPTSSAR